MAIAFADRVKESSTSTGTGNFTLAGAVTGFRTFSSAVGVGSYFYYAIVSSSGTEWEVGLGVLGNSTTLVRPTNPFANSANTIGKLNFSAGTKNVFLTLPASAANTVVLGNVAGTPESYDSYTAIGANTSVGGTGATVMGASAAASAANATAIGVGTTASASDATAVGQNNTASGQYSVAVGVGAAAGGPSTIAIGRQAYSPSDRGVAIGEYATSGSVDTAVGQGTGATGGFSSALGTYANATNSYATALGGSITADQPDQFCVRVRLDPSGVSGTYSLKYDNARKEVYASSSGGGGGVTQIVAGTGISISSTGPFGTGIVTINATGGGAGLDWFTIVTSPLPATLTAPTDFTSTPSGPGYLVAAGYASGAPWGPSGPWSSGNTAGWFGQSSYVQTFNWSSIVSPYPYTMGSPGSGIAFNYTQYPPGHTNIYYVDVFGSAAFWNNGFGSSYNFFYPSPPGANKKMFVVFVVQSGGTDLTGVYLKNPAYPGINVVATYDVFAGVTVFAVENLVDMEVFNILNNNQSMISWGPGSYSFYGHGWYEYS